MIIITSGEYITPQLRAEFGKIPPSFLPLANKRLYIHQVELMASRAKNKEKIILTVPQGYEIYASDLKKLDSLEVTIVKVSESLSLKESLLYTLNMLLPIDESVSILHGDTLFTQINLSSTEDRLEVAQSDSYYDWTYIAPDGNPIFNTTNFLESNVNEESIVSGYFNFTSAYALIQALIRSEGFISALKIYSQERPFKLTLNNTWLDFGLTSTYFHSRKNFTTERAFNSLKIENGYVEKSSEKEGKLFAEINWFTRFPQSAELFLPRFSAENDNSYKTEYLYLSGLNELFVFGALPAYTWKQIFSSTNNFLNQLHQNKIDEKVNFIYKEKTLERLVEFTQKLGLDMNKSWCLNGEQFPSLNAIIKSLDLYMNSEFESCYIHGDMHFANIMYDFRSELIKIFDPRGMDFDGKVTPAGHKLYDFAKLQHSVIGLYDFIIAGLYELNYSKPYELSFELNLPENIQNIQNIFDEVFNLSSNKEVFAITIHLFLSMIPLHDDDEQRQFALLANAFRLYKIFREGV
ncbi:hypothetical protein ACTXNH_10265 [Psychrobacter celer]|uniref:hypothetical protein n=1 Tax=Psychrobacter celer TaxID=306572 RepID=UPI003FD3E2F2